MSARRSRRGAPAAAGPAARRAGFTLVELLVVIGIIAILLAILLPAAARINYRSKVVRCSANLGQFAVAANHYAIENDGYLPGLSMIGTGGNVWDVSNQFVSMMTIKYGQKPRFGPDGLPLAPDAMYCPLLDHTVMEDEYGRFTNFRVIGYMVWIPRPNGRELMPPLKHGDDDARYDYPATTERRTVAGPRRLSDATAQTNPIFTDLMASPTTVTPPADADPTAPGNPYKLTGTSNHRFRGALTQCNQAYADGHVETVPSASLRPRYAGNWWNWR